MALILVFVNVAGGEDDAAYNVEVLIGDGTPERSQTIATGKVEGHQRSAGYIPLVQKFLDQQKETKQEFDYRPLPSRRK